MPNYKDSPVYRAASPIGRASLDKIGKMTPPERWLWWIAERESIRLKREFGKPPPWTTNPILANFRFCNARRQDDKVSKWLYDNWYKPHFDHPNMLVAVVIARHFNQPHALERITDLVFERYEPDEIVKTLARLKAKGTTIFNGAYMIRSSSGSSPVFYADKHEMVIYETAQQFIDKPPKLDTDSMEKCVETICGYRNFGTFMAGQIVGDLRWAMKGKWKDKDTWAPIGPGSRKGMNVFMGRPVSFPLKQKQFLTELQEAIKLAKKKLPESITSRLEALDFQNCFCEVSKMERCLFGYGKPKQNYPGAK